MTKSVWFFTGAKGTGKSTAAARFARPSEIDSVAVFDTEDSMSDIIRNNKKLGVEFGAYIRAYDRLKSYLKLKDQNEWNDQLLTRISKGDLPWRDEAEQFGLAEYWEWFLKEIDRVLVPGKFKFFVIDTIEPIEAGCAAWAQKNKKLSGFRSMAYAQGEVEAIRPLLENVMESIHQRGIEHILVTSHTKTPWVEGVGGKSRPVNDRIKPGGRLKVWSRISTAMLWMTKGNPPNSANAPSAIVLKARLSDTKIANNEWDIRDPIPPRIPAFSWKAWREYEQHGWNPLEPKPGELLYPEEERMMSELLSNEEYKLMILDAQIALKEKEGVGNIVGSLEIPESGRGSGWESKAKELAESGYDVNAIAKELNKPPVVVRKVIGG